MKRISMSATSRRMLSVSVLTLCVALLGPIFRGADAATMSYGSFGPVPPGVSFLNVEESSGTDPVPLYGAPTAFSIGLDFDPRLFVATSSGGGADLTDGQLNFTVRSGVGIASLGLFERGDYTLAGVGTAATEVQAGAIILATVTAINGIPVPPINLFPVNASVSFDLPNNAGITQPWSLGIGLNVAAQLGAGQAATRIDVVIDNALVATSERQSTAFIAKKDFIFRVEVVPEPSSIVLAGLFLCGLGAIAARKRPC